MNQQGHLALLWFQTTQNLLRMPFYKVRNATLIVSNILSPILPSLAKSKMENIEIAKIPFPNKDVPKHPSYLLWKFLGLGLGLGLGFGRNSQTQIWLETFFVE